jgi:hypothetical protein
VIRDAKLHPLFVVFLFVIPENNRFNNMELTGYVYYQISDRIGVDATVNYNIKNESLQRIKPSYAGLNMGVYMSLLKNKELSLSLGLQDVFESSKVEDYKLYYGNNVFDRKMQYLPRYLNLSESYLFQGGKSFNKKDSETNDTQRFSK